MANTVEEWAPIFLFYSNGSPKYTKEQVLDPKFAATFGFCKLCDAPIQGNVEEHMRGHRKELTAWLAKRRRTAAAKSQAGLKAARRNRKEQRQHEDR